MLYYCSWVCVCVSIMRVCVCVCVSLCVMRVCLCVCVFVCDEGVCMMGVCAYHEDVCSCDASKN